MKRFAVYCLACAALAMLPAASAAAEAAAEALAGAAPPANAEANAEASEAPAEAAAFAEPEAAAAGSNAGSEALAAADPAAFAEGGAAAGGAQGGAQGGRSPVPPARTVVPERPDPALPNYGVGWVPAASAAAALAAQAGEGGEERAAPEVSIRLVITVDGSERVIELPRPTVGAVVDALAPAAQVATPAAPPPRPVELTVAPSAPVAQALAGRPAAISPRMPAPDGAGVYRVQVGSFARTALAQASFDRLRAAGFDPRFERFQSEAHGRVYRVVIPGVGASEMRGVAQRLGSAGFEAALIRREN